MKRGSIKILIISLVVVYAIAFISSIFTSNNADSEWYNSVKPKITPPNLVFPIVWNILYFLIALSFYFSWISIKNKNKKSELILLFASNLLLNALWSYFFFELRLPMLAFFDLILILLSTVITMNFVKKINKASFYFLLPYLLWVFFAGILNFLIAF